MTPETRRKVMILGGGPNRIGQGIEFDYCCCHASFALREAGFATVMVNSNPETVSTDYDTSDRLYFEPLTLEDVLNVIEAEQPDGVIVQFGGQTPLKLALPLLRWLESPEGRATGTRLWGTSPESIDRAEDREQFEAILRRLDIRQPRNGLARSDAEARAVAAAWATRWWCGPATCWAAGPWRWSSTRRSSTATWWRRCRWSPTTRC